MTRRQTTAPEPERRPAGKGRLARWLPTPGPDVPAAEPSAGERRIWRIIGVLVLACVLVGGAATTGAALVQQDIVRERTYFDAIHRLDIDSGPAQVTVRAGGTDRVVVTERVGWSLRRPAVSQQLGADTLSVVVDCPEARVLFGCAVALEIQVPAATAITSHSGSGRTEILDIAGATTAETGSGQIELNRVSGAIQAKSGSGQIIGAGLTSAEAKVVSSSGQITLQYDRPPNSVTARLASGDLVLQVPDDRSRYRIDLSSAGAAQVIDPSLPDATSSRMLDIVTASGTVTVNRIGGRH
ncbi:DUF4097 family beta strand repeat-containing protein [Kitasatospora sp. CB01950]|uniref:DUF4097 family beta strand repeat-containing protein n=1 Tax=Kitasatospora sp. CB01950 TaxID=1703930 RepID=UPI00093D38B8|nr:DUF4097 family beta strand repeat-containing protein [Kitasatospora sp. CB01950]OKJ10354.1 hypothetical protein AMK19_16000 [Kitasatospora sp. CB01950]